MTYLSEVESKRLAEQEVGETWGCPGKVKAGFLGHAVEILGRTSRSTSRISKQVTGRMKITITPWVGKFSNSNYDLP